MTIIRRTQLLPLLLLTVVFVVAYAVATLLLLVRSNNKQPWFREETDIQKATITTTTQTTIPTNSSSSSSSSNSLHETSSATTKIATNNNNNLPVETLPKEIEKESLTSLLKTNSSQNNSNNNNNNNKEQQDQVKKAEGMAPITDTDDTNKDQSTMDLASNNNNNTTTLSVSSSSSSTTTATTTTTTHNTSSTTAEKYSTLPGQTIILNGADENGGSWKCCVDLHQVEVVLQHPHPTQVQDRSHDYSCPDTPSNFSWFYSTPQSPEPIGLRPELWQQPLKIAFVGGSVSRQMHEQLLWEMPKMTTTKHVMAQYLFQYHEVGKKYQHLNIVDFSQLDVNLIAALQEGHDFVVINVASWWDTPNIGHIIDETGAKWDIDANHNHEWRIVNTTTTSQPKPNVTFAYRMDQAFHMALTHKHPNTQLIWRSEGATFCHIPPGQDFRASIIPVLHQHNIPILNISQSTCQYVQARQGLDDGVHLCFPSVALRHWLLAFQQQFLIPRQHSAAAIISASQPQPSTNNTSSAEASNTQRRVVCPHETDLTTEQHQVPQMIVVGAMKGGTSAVLKLLDMHQDLVKATDLWPGTREVHYFDHTNYTNLPANQLSDQVICQMRQEYTAKWTLQKPSNDNNNKPLAYFEKSPSYIAYPHVPSQIQTVCPWTKILILLRDPVERSHSHFKHTLGKAHERNLPHADFPTLLMKELEQMKKLGLSKAPTISEFIAMQNTSTDEQLTKAFAIPSVPFANRFPTDNNKQLMGYLHLSLYSHQVAQYLRYFNATQVKVVPYEIFKEQPQEIVSDILKWVGVADKVYPNTVLHKNYHQAHEEHSMNNDTKAWLQYFFRSYNEELVALLAGQDPRWKGLWKYELELAATG